MYVHTIIHSDNICFNSEYLKSWEVYISEKEDITTVEGVLLI